MNTTEYRSMMGLPPAGEQEHIKLNTQEGVARFNALVHGIEERVNKYNNQKTIVDGIAFDSKHEADVYAELKFLEDRGIISNLKLQVKFELLAKIKGVQRAINYYADFVFTEFGKTVVLEAKGFMTDVAKNKLKMFRAKYPEIELRISYQK